VSLSQAGVERPGTPEEHARFSASVQEVLTRFFHDTNWRPNAVKSVAGVCLYTRYNFLIRMVMKRISRQAGGSTDTTRDHEYTNWGELDRFINVFTRPLLTPNTSCEYSPAVPVGTTHC
jgi:menaquinone-dependent protoporphyrinogen oxidase